MPIVAIVQQKGGVGKSTITANLAGELLEAHRKVVLFDLDPQKSLTRWAQRGQGILRARVQAMEIAAAHHRVFCAAVNEALEDADYVLLDSPPGFADAAISAALVADLALVPVTPSPLDLLAAKEARDLIRQAQVKRGDSKPVIAFVPSRMTRTTWSRNLTENLQAFGELVYPGISQRVAYVDSILDGLTLREYARGHEGVGDFQRLAAAVQQTMGGQ